MFIVFTKPNKFTKTYTEACQIAEEYYNNTGEIAPVEKSELGEDYNPFSYITSQ